MKRSSSDSTITISGSSSCDSSHITSIEDSACCTDRNSAKSSKSYRKKTGGSSYSCTDSSTSKSSHASGTCSCDTTEVSKTALSTGKSGTCSCSRNSATCSCSYDSGTCSCSYATGTCSCSYTTGTCSCGVSKTYSCPNGGSSKYTCYHMAGHDTMMPPLSPSRPSRGRDPYFPHVEFVSAGESSFSVGDLPSVIMANADSGNANIMLEGNFPVGTVLHVKNISAPNSMGRPRIMSASGNIEHYDECGNIVSQPGVYSLNTHRGAVTFLSEGRGNWGILSQHIGNRGS